MKNDNVYTIEELNERIRILTIEKRAVKEEVAEKNIELENKRRELIEVEDQLSRYTKEKERIRRVNKSHSTNNECKETRVGDVIEILNTYTRFSTWTKIKSIENTVKLRRKLPNYNKDKFGVVTNVETGTYAGQQFNKVHFITDSGKETWRKQEYVKVHHGERGVVAHSRQRGWRHHQAVSESNDE